MGVIEAGITKVTHPLPIPHLSPINTLGLPAQVDLSGAKILNGMNRSYDEIVYMSRTEVSSSYVTLMPRGVSPADPNFVVKVVLITLLLRLEAASQARLAAPDRLPACGFCVIHRSQQNSETLNRDAGVCNSCEITPH